MIRHALIASAALLAVSLGGCALLSSPDPVQTYRFGVSQEGPVDLDGTLAPISVSLRPVELPDASEDDRILSVTGVQTAYIGGARWVSRAEELFDSGLRGAFAARGDQVRLLNRREPGTGPLVLTVTVSTFEARYAAPGAAPDVVITAQAQLRTRGDRRPGQPIRPEDSRVIEKVFTVTEQAGANRVSAIVEAFDTGVRDLNTQIVDWTIQNGG